MELIYFIWLSILNLKPIEKLKLLELFKDPKRIYDLSERRLNELTDDIHLKKELRDKDKIKQAKYIIDESLNIGINIITCKDKYYPRALKKIVDYPIVIYAKGDIGLLNKADSIAIVGTRNSSNYGRIVTSEFSKGLSKRGKTIVSGLARGIDSYAHLNAIENIGKTIAVLGCGIDFIYPKDNAFLYYKIIEKNGLIISEYPLDTRPNQIFFPQRNRIISGISEKILVTEAGERSGSIITANIAAEQGKSVYAVPGNIFSQMSKGTNELIKDGAILVSSIEDVLNL